MVEFALMPAPLASDHRGKGRARLLPSRGLTMRRTATVRHCHEKRALDYRIRHLASAAHLHVKLVSTQQRHPNQRIGVRFANEDAAQLPIPRDLRLVHVEEAVAPISEHPSPGALP
jgi:hypothetical protein